MAMELSSVTASAIENQEKQNAFQILNPFVDTTVENNQEKVNKIVNRVEDTKNNILPVIEKNVDKISIIQGCGVWKECDDLTIWLRERISKTLRWLKNNKEKIAANNTNYKPAHALAA